MFAGIGGFRSALDPLGGECVFASEIDPFATKSYRALYNGAPELHGDITKINERDIPDHDVLVGGFPCQAFSVAGQRKGFEDARGTLFFEIARIAAIKQPRLMLLENVKGLLSHDGGHTLEVMASVLNDIGYTIDFHVLNSKHYGVPQNRERIFIVCSRDAEHIDWSVVGNDVVAKAKRRIKALGVRTFNFDWPTNDTVTTRLRDVLEPNVDKRYYLSEEKTAKLIAQLNEQDNASESDECEMIGHVDGINGHDICRRVYSPIGVAPIGVAPTIPTGSSGNTTPKVVIDEEPLCIQQNQQRKVFIKSEVGTLHASMTNNQAPKILEPQIEKVGHLLCDSGQTGAIYGTDGIAPTCLNQHGNAVTKVAVQMNRHKIAQGTDISHCLMARDYKGFGNQDMTGVIEVAGTKPRYRIRKLTPLECWRLQGFSDAAHNIVATAGISDSQRYKQAGNAVTVNVISAIGKRLIPLLVEGKPGDVDEDVYPSVYEME